MDKAGMVDSVKDQIAKWADDAHPYAWNCGPGGRSFGKIDYSTFPTISNADFEAAVGELRTYVKDNLAGHSGRSAKSLSGAEAGYNVWSFLIEPCDNKPRKLNYHIRIA